MGDGQSIQIAETVELKTDPRFQRSAWQEKGLTKVLLELCFSLENDESRQGGVHSTI